MKKVLLSMILSSAFAATAIAQNIATVNGTPIPAAREKMLIEQIEQMNPGTTLKQEEIDQLRDNLITQEVLYQEAIKQGLDKTPHFKEQMEIMQRSVLIKNLFDSYAKKNPIDDKAIEAEYTKIIEASSIEYTVRHILVEKEEEAKELITQIEKGADFAELAKTKSIDKGTAPEGGLLERVTSEGMVPEFAKAMEELKKGEVSKAPVKTRYGWHIIKMEELHKPSKEDFPELDDRMKEQLKQILQDRAFSEYQKKLIDSADIQLNKK